MTNVMQEDAKYVLINYPLTSNVNDKVAFKFIRLSIDQLMNQEDGEEPLYQHLSASFLTPYTNCAYAPSKDGLLVQLLGCLGRYDGFYKVYSFNLSKNSNRNSFVQLEDMPLGSEMGSSLVVSVGDNIYHVSYPIDCTRVEGNKSHPLPIFQRYNLEGNYWQIVEDSSTALVKVPDCDEFICSTISRAPHVVIGSKLHLSLGKSSFTFDTNKGVWEECKLFETFWLDTDYRKSEPSSPYSFGFSGKGILYGEDILLGVNCGFNCPLVAYKLGNDTDGERVVVQSQLITTAELGLPNKIATGRLVDLGRDGCFGLVHFVHHDEPYQYLFSPGDMEMTIFQVERVEGDSGHFLDCQFVRRQFLVASENLNTDVEDFYNVYCV